MGHPTQRWPARQLRGVLRAGGPVPTWEDGPADGGVAQMALPMLEKLVETRRPNVRMATMATTAMRATRRPYSTREAPVSSVRSNLASSQVFRMNRSMGRSRRADVDRLMDRHTAWPSDGASTG